MNILITSVGRRVKVIQYFMQVLGEQNGRVLATDMDVNAPALHFADQYFIVPRIDTDEYIHEILTICNENNISHLFSLIDPELELLIQNKSLFDEIGVQLILSPLDMVQMTFDKYETANFLNSYSIPTVPTYISKNDILEEINQNKIDYPLIAKPRKGSASIGITLINNKNELDYIDDKNQEIIFQPFYKDKEFGVDVYIDLISGKLVNMFIKEKLRMRSGETDKSISIHNHRIEKLIQLLIQHTSFAGPIDVDVFEYNGEYFISEINPRFGGGYPHAYECGVNFPEYVMNNIQGAENFEYDGFSYGDNKVMMKYDDILIR